MSKLNIEKCKAVYKKKN